MGQLAAPHRARRMSVADGDDDVDRLNALLSEWREPLITRVLPRLVIPDGTNRAATGVSLEHAHGIAMNIAERGFDVDHDVPVVVRQDAREMLRSDAYARWERFTRANAAVLPATSSNVWEGEPYAFLTLGSSHLNLALKLIEHDVPSVFSRTVSYGSALSRDKRLRDAVYDGLPSVVLRPSTPADVRREISIALNRAEDVGFRIDDDGRAIRVRDPSNAKELTVYEALSRTLDSEELSSLARVKHGLDLSDADAGYVAATASNGARSRL